MRDGQFARRPRGSLAQRFCLDTVRVLLLLDVLRQLSLLPNVFAYGAPVSACGKGSMPVWAVQRFDEMRQEVPQLEVITCTALLSACGKGGKPECAVQHFDEMRQEVLRPTWSPATPCSAHAERVVYQCGSGCSRGDEA